MGDVTELDALNKMDDRCAAQRLEPLIERAPDIAARVAGKRPYISPAALIAQIRHELRALPQADRIALFQAHPELAPAHPNTMTDASQREQSRLNLTESDNTFQARLAPLNAAYRAKFGFPFIVALSRHAGMDSVLAEFETRLRADRPSEIASALEQVCIVSADRAQRAFGSTTEPSRTEV